MKKLLLSAAIAVLGLVNTNAQATGFEAGAYVGFPSGDASDGTSLNLGINVAYLWNVSESFKAGVTAGYDLWMAKEVDGVKGDNVSYIPVAATAKYSFGQFFVGLDLGYAVGMTSSESSYDMGGVTVTSEAKSKGGFLYQPKFGYSGASFDVYGFYKGISDKMEATVEGGGFSTSVSENANISSFGVGFAYKF